MTINKFCVVNKEEAEKDPYPYVYVEEDGTYSEIDNENKKYLETKFYPSDGDRPYIKSGFYSKTPDGKLGGFLKRSKLPKGLKKGDMTPPKPWWRFW